MNLHIVSGNMGHDPVLEEIPTSGTPVCNVSVATDESYRDRDTGERVKRTEWHRVTFFGKSAQAVAEYGCKGRSIFVSGPVRRRKTEDSTTGAEKVYADIIAREWRFTGPSPNGTGGNGRSEGEPSSSDFDDDIPF